MIENSLLAMLVGVGLICAAGIHDERRWGDHFSEIMGVVGLVFFLGGYVCLLTSILIAIFI